MNLQELLDERKFSCYRVSIMSGIPQSTLRDICSCKSSIGNCSAKTVQKLAIALDCKMEDLMRLDNEKVGCRAKDYLTKSEYFKAMIKDKNVILAFESALEQYNLTIGNFNSKIIVYGLEPLPKPFKVHLVNSFNAIDYEDVRGLKTTSLNKTINDMLSSDDIDPQILAEGLSNYYFSHGESFEGIDIKEKNVNKYKEYQQLAIEYYDEQ